MIAGDSGNHHRIVSWAWFADVDAALEEGAITNADALCGYIPGQRTFTADVHMIAGIDITAHLAKNHHFTSGDIRRYLVSRLTVTRLSGKLIAPSTLPSMYNDSEPITSPLICRLLPIVAGSAALGIRGRCWKGSIHGLPPLIQITASVPRLEEAKEFQVGFALC